MDPLHEPATDHAAPAMPGEAQLLAMMEQSDRDVAAGLTVPLADVLAELDAIAAEVEARHPTHPV